MGSPAFKKQLIHRAVFLAGSISRTASGDVTEVWAPIDNGNCGTVAGRFVHRYHAIAEPYHGLMMKHQHLWLCDSSEDVQEEYRLRNFTDENGDAVAEANGTWGVGALIPRRTRKLHHYELTLEKVE